MEGSDTHNELNETWQTLAAPTARALVEMFDNSDADHRDEEDQREKNGDKNSAAELEIIQSRLRFLNLIELALRRRGEKKN